MLLFSSVSVQELLLSSNDLEDLLETAEDGDSVRAKLTVSRNVVTWFIFSLYGVKHQQLNS